MVLISKGGKLTVMDCITPTILSIIAGILFAPIKLFAASIFSPFTCIGGGILFSAALMLYKNGRMKGWALILPALTFVYELLPIELPTDLDNFLALGGASASMWIGYIKTAALANSNSGNKATQLLD